MKLFDLAVNSPMAVVRRIVIKEIIQIHFQVREKVMKIFLKLTRLSIKINESAYSDSDNYFKIKTFQKKFC